MKKEKAILLSIKPKYVLNILNGNKILELRRTVPKDFKGWVYIYVTKNGGYLDFSIGELDNGLFTVDVGGFRYEKRLNDFEIPEDINLLNGKVVARFWLDNITEYSIEKWSDQEIVIPLDTLTITRDTMKNFLSDTCLTFNEIWDYAKPSKYTPEKQKFIYAWQIKKLEIFDVPYDLSYFYKKRTDKEYAQKLFEFSFIYDNGETPLRYIELERAPQNWQYVFFSKGAIV